MNINSLFDSSKSNKKTFIIGEVGSNHNLNKDTVKELIINCKKANFDSVKFQIYDAEEAFSKNEKVSDVNLTNFYDEGPWWKVARDIILMPRDWFKEMFEFSRKNNLIPICTVHREEDAYFLNKLGINIFKIASIDMNHKYLLKKIIKFNKPLIISTGMSLINEIADTVDFLRTNNFNKFNLLHCVSQYPPKYEEQNLRNIPMLKKMFDVNIGYSDHSTGYLSSVIAVSLGAKIIEKHITTDKNYPGPDHSFALELNEMRELQKNIRLTEKSLGVFSKKISKNEFKARKVIRRSIVLKKDLKKGQKLKHSDVKFARPGTGINPNYFNLIEGRKLKQNVKAETILNLNMFE